MSIKELERIETEYAAIDKRSRKALEAFATRWCFSISECGWWDGDTPKDMSEMPFRELQWHIRVIEMDIYLDRKYDAINSGG